MSFTSKIWYWPLALVGAGELMSGSETQQDRQERPAIPEFDRFGFRGHFDPPCGSNDDRSSTSAIRELNKQRSYKPRY